MTVIAHMTDHRDTKLNRERPAAKFWHSVHRLIESAPDLTRRTWYGERFNRYRDDY